MSSNIEFAKRLKKEEAEAIQDLIINTQGWCFKYIMKRGGTKEQVKDLMNEMIIRLIQKLRTDNLQLTNINAYYTKMVKNAWLEQKRKKKQAPQVLALDDPDQYLQIVRQMGYQPQEGDLVDKRILAVRESWQGIKPDCRNLLHQFYVLEEKLIEIAEKMGYTYNFVRVKKKRCWDAFEEIFFLKLKKLLEDG